MRILSARFLLVLRFLGRHVTHVLVNLRKVEFVLQVVDSYGVLRDHRVGLRKEYVFGSVLLG